VKVGIFDIQSLIYLLFVLYAFMYFEREKSNFLAVYLKRIFKICLLWLYSLEYGHKS